VLLPDGTVFVTGGSLKQEDVPLARLQSEIYDPIKNEWTLTASASVPRLYHSTALLLPDGRVVAAGGNPDATQLVEWDKDPLNEEMRLEIYSPPYLFKGSRPAITQAPKNWSYGENKQINSPDALDIRSACLIRNCVTTHSYDTNQRLVELDVLSQNAGHLTAQLTKNLNIAPPGWYMLFIVNTSGIPSVAEWVHVI
jgi:hypothetical protein